MSATPTATDALQAPQAMGRLWLIPCPLDFGMDLAQAPELSATIPMEVIQRAAQLKFWVAENAKSARHFLNRVNNVCPLSQPLQTLDIRELSKPAKGSTQGGLSAQVDWASWLAPLLQGHDMGLISEAGLPAVADPGSELVLAAHQMGLPVCAMSGPNSLILALSASGLQGQSFAFWGYMPQRPDERKQQIQNLERISAQHRQTQMAIETPYRNPVLAQALIEHLAPDTLLSVSAALTAPGGWTHTDTVQGWRQRPPQDRWPLRTDWPMVFCWLAQASARINAPDPSSGPRRPRPLKGHANRPRRP